MLMRVMVKPDHLNLVNIDMKWTQTFIYRYLTWVRILLIFGHSQEFPIFGQRQILPIFGQGEKLPIFGQGEKLPIFGQGEKLPMILQGEKLPIFDLSA